MTKTIIFDLEATCWSGSEREGKIMEIIEVGAVKIDENGNVIDEFNCFVKPKLNPQLSDFCNQLTSITQQEVDNSKGFEESMHLFENWITKGNEGEEILLLSWGFYDKKQILMESEVKNYKGKIISLLDKHSSLKHLFAESYKIKPCEIDEALWILKLAKFEGIKHRGIDDAKNIARIYQAARDRIKLG
jgi:inhibitor of KinA sporulation pathway (predicted exonuclease)